MSNPVAQVRQFPVAVPAGTGIAAPAATATAFGEGFTVEWIELQVPAGTRGAVGIAILSSGVQVIPYTTGNTRNWLVVDGYDKRWDMTGLPDSGDWSVLAYNTGNYPHTFWLRFGLSVPPAAVVVVPPLVLLPGASLSGVLT